MFEQLEDGSEFYSFTDSEVDLMSSYQYELVPVRDAVNRFETISLGKIKPVNLFDLGIKATIEDGITRVSWNGIEGATSYRLNLYSQNKETGVWEKEGFSRNSIVESYEFKGLIEGNNYKIEVIPFINYVYDTTKTGFVVVTIPFEENKTIDTVQNVKAISIDGTVNISWDPLTTEGEEASQYRVQRYVKDENGEWVKDGFAPSTNQTSYSFNDLKGNKEYYFEIIPCTNRYIYESAGTSNVIIGPIKEEIPVSIVQSVTAVANDTEVTVTWDALEGATRYRVQAYVKDPVTGEFVKDGFGRTTSNNSINMKFLDEGKTYKFEVIPNIDGSYVNESKGVSNVVDIVIVEETNPVVESKLNVTIDGTTAHISWDTIEDATRYRVQRYILNEETGKFEKDSYARTVNGTEISLSGLIEGMTYKFQIVPQLGFYDQSKAIYGKEKIDKKEN